MSFLSKALTSNPGAGVKPPVPPTKKPVAPVGVPPVKKPMVMPSKPAAPKPTMTPGAVTKPNPFKKDVAPVKEPVVEEEATEVDLGINNEEVVVPEVVKEAVEETEPIAIEPDFIETVEEVEQEAKETKEVEETKKKTTKKTTRSKAKKEETVSDDSAVAILNLPKVDINTIEDYMYPVILPTVEGWEQEKEEVNEVIATLEIDADMNPGTARVLLADMASAFGMLNKKLTHYKTQYENLVGKDGIIECIKAIHGQGKNAEERKFAATEACMNYVKPGEDVAANLFEYEYMIRERFYFYEGVVKELEFKRQLLITFNGMLNAESRI